jgi:subtilisin
MKKIFSILLVIALLLGFTIPVSASQGDYLVLLQKPITLEGFQVNHHYKHINAVSISANENQIKGLLRNPDVLLIEPDGEVEALEYTWNIEQIEADIVHSQNITGESVKVAIIDTGIDYTHSELNYVGGYDFVNKDNDPMDDDGHGTHCAGILAASLNGMIVGVAPNVELYALKVLDQTGTGSWSDVMAAVDWCIENNIQITSNSYGGGSCSQSVRRAFDAAWEAGILSIAAAGNAGGNENVDRVIYPANLDSVMAVAATDSNKVRAAFSSTGPALEVSAPGAGIYSTIPGNNYGYKSGTSMACPHVAGLAALIKSAHSDWDNEIIRGQIKLSAEDLGPYGHDWLYGFGLINAPLACGDLIVPEPPEPPSSIYVAEINFESTGPHVYVDVVLSHPVDDAGISLLFEYVDKSETAMSFSVNGIASFRFWKIPSCICKAIVLEITNYEWDKSKGRISNTYVHRKEGKGHR